MPEIRTNKLYKFSGQRIKFQNSQPLYFIFIFFLTARFDNYLLMNKLSEFTWSSPLYSILNLNFKSTAWQSGKFENPDRPSLRAVRIFGLSLYTAAQFEEILHCWWVKWEKLPSTFTTPSGSKSNCRITMTGALKRIWNENVVARFKELTSFQPTTGLTCTILAANKLQFNA